MKQWEVSDGADGVGEDFCLQSSVQTGSICRGGIWGMAHLVSCSAKSTQTWDQPFFFQPQANVFHVPSPRSLLRDAHYWEDTCTSLLSAQHTPGEGGDGDQWLALCLPAGSHPWNVPYKKGPPGTDLLPAHVYRERSTRPYKGCIARAFLLALLCSPAFLGINPSWLV